MTDRLSEFLRSIADRRFKLGEWDCGLWLADWYMAATGKPDPAKHLRGSVYNADALQEHMLPIISALAFEETTEPKRGDIAMIKFDGRTTGAICSGSRWLVLGKGIAAIPVRSANLITAWRIK